MRDERRGLGGRQPVRRKKGLLLEGAVILTLVLGVFLLVSDFIRSETQIDGVFERNSYGKGGRTEEINVEIQGKEEKIPVEVEIAERQYSPEEVRKLFGRIIRKMEGLILGENVSLDRIEYNMNLLTQIPDEPVEVTWELDRYDVMNIRGELQPDFLNEEGTLITLNAVLTYSENEEEQALFQCTAQVFPKIPDDETKTKNQIEDAIRKREEESRTSTDLKLPEKISNKNASYYRKMDSRGLVLIMMSVLMGVLLYALEIQNQRKEQENRKQQMILDYPEIVNKMTLFLGAGMTAKRAWRKIAEDYSRQKELWGERYAYEEMKISCREMDSGIAESESYENFGRRCDVQMYIKFGALLSQNLRKGTKGMTQLLKIESVQAFEERKARAKRLGEEAGTKLLLPMFLMLAVVLVIVIVPAFLSVQI